MFFVVMKSNGYVHDCKLYVPLSIQNISFDSPIPPAIRNHVTTLVNSTHHSLILKLES